jgi:hypothetical protein
MTDRFPGVFDGGPDLPHFQARQTRRQLQVGNRLIFFADNATISEFATTTPVCCRLVRFYKVEENIFVFKARWRCKFLQRWRRNTRS